MKKTTFVAVLLLFAIQFSLSQETYKRITIQQPDNNVMHLLASEGIDLRCGIVHEHDAITLDIPESKLEMLQQRNINFSVEIEDLTQFYSERAARDLPKAQTELASEKTRTTNYRQNISSQRSSVSTIIQDNVIQYEGCNEIDWTVPLNFNLGSLGGGMTVSEMEAELDDMYSYSQTNSLDIVSQKLDASPTGQTTWGNPTSTITNNGLTYTGMGTTRWDPKTIYYVRITGNQSSTPENTKPQMLFTSMIHAREPASLMNNMFFMWYLIENYNNDPAVTELVDNNELYFVPIVNPDGVRWNEHLSPSGGTFQRKNCRPNTGSTSNSTEVRGVDLNRNFDYFWAYNNIGSSGTASSQTYRGPSPTSEPETQIMVDFILGHNFKTAVWNHSYANSVPHPYGGIPTLQSGREDEFHRWHEEMTRYNRYLYGATIFYESNGIPDDWMLGGAPDNNGSTGSDVALLGTTPEHGSSSDGFWPSTSSYVPIAKRSMRISFGTAYYGGQYAKLHDLTQSNITSTTASLDFGIERIGQTDSDFTVTVTPISSNIVSITSPAIETGMSVLEQRTVTASLQLDSGITTNEPIEYNVKLSNDNGVIYEADFVKYYQPTLLFDHNPDVSGLSGWNQSGGWNNTAVDTYSGSNALRTGDAVPYANNSTKTLTTANSYDLSGATEILVQYYAKWDLERNYDFVEIQGSTDGSTWQSLCGKYTKPNATSTTTSHDNKGGTSTFQQSNSTGQLYDGDRMDNWVMEEIVINDTNNSFMVSAANAQFRFIFRSDSSNVSENYSTTSDGFFLDDFKIISVQIPCQTTIPTNVSISQTSTSSADVTWDAIPSATYDLRYREVGSSTWTEVTDLATNNYSLTGLITSTEYEVQVATRCTSTTSGYGSSATVVIIPCTGNVVSTFPYNESFETDLGFWTQSINGTEDDIDWTWNSGSTPSTSTGPSVASDGSFYLYTEASTNVTPAGSPNKIAYLVGPCIDLSNFINSQLTFDYHMYGADIGTLELQISTDDGANYNPVFNISGQQQTSNAAAWTNQVVDLSAYDGSTVKLRFYGFTGSSFNGDIAIDNITITADEATLTNHEFNYEDVTIYPNPFNDALNIKLSPNLLGHNMEINLIDIRGRLITTQKINEQNFTLDNINVLSSGSYFIKIKDLKSGQTITKKLIKN